MEERRVSFAAQNEIDAEQAFLNSMKALQELDEAGAPLVSSGAAAQSNSNSSDGGGDGNGLDLEGGHDSAIVEDTEEQNLTPNPGAGASTNFGATVDATVPASSGSSSPVVSSGVAQENATSSPSPPSSSSTQRRSAVPFSYDEEDNDPGSTALLKDENDESARSTVTTDTSTPAPSPALARNSPNENPVSLTPPVSTPTPSINKPSTPISLVVPEDTSTQNATPLFTTNEIPPSSNIAGFSQEQKQAPMGVITSSSSDVVPSITAGTGAGVSAVATTAASTPTTNTTTTTAAPSNKRKRLPQDKVGQLEDRIAEDPRGDIDAWYSLIAEHQKKGKSDEARAVYERFFLVFPACAEQWIAYVKMELANNEFIRVEQIFSRCLIPVQNVELWSLYLNYIRRRQNLTIDTGGRARAIVSQAYEFVLNNVGVDREAGPIWQEYVQFVKSSPGNIGGSGWQDQQKMDLLRKVYQRAICIPVQGVEQLWREYDGFEMGLNKITGRKFLQEKSPLFMTARSSFIELNNITAGLIRTTVPRLPPLPGFEGYEEYQRQIELWKKWIQWEKGDPLVLAKDDPVALRNRILYVYKQALMAKRFCPEIWFDTAGYCFSSEMYDQGMEFLKQGIAANPESCLLTFRYAERLEASMPAEDGTGMEGVKRRGQAVRKPYEELLNALYTQVAKVQQREKDELAKIEEMMPTSSRRRRLSAGGEVEFDDDEDDDDDEDVDAVANRAAKEAQTQYIKDATKAQVTGMSKTISAVWVNLMRAMRRIEGHGKVGDPATSIGGSRQVFADARKRGKITSDVYVASALIEYHCYKDPAATRIFERGMRLFPEDEEFALEYLKHLIAINDITNARAVFETFVGRVPANKAKRVWHFFYDYESQYGDLGQIYKLEKRMGELYPKDPYLNRFTARYSYSTINPSLYQPIISPQQLRAKGLIPLPPPPQPQPHQPLFESTLSQPPALSHTNTTNTTLPPQRPITTPAASTTNNVPPSPKRSAHELDISDAENAPSTSSAHSRDHRPPAKKVHRGDSPLKGAAGRRLDQQKQRLLSQQRQREEGGASGRGPMGGMGGGGGMMGMGGVGSLSVIPDAVMFLLGIIPGAQSYNAVRFKPEAIVSLLRDVQLPGQVPQGALGGMGVGYGYGR